MSYILDALRKSESERHQGQVPNLGSNPMLIHVGRNERALWPYILAGGLFLNAVVIGLWLYHSRDMAPVAESAAPVSTQPVVTGSGPAAAQPHASLPPVTVRSESYHNGAQQPWTSGGPTMPPATDQQKPIGTSVAEPMRAEIPNLANAAGKNDNYTPTTAREQVWVNHPSGLPVSGPVDEGGSEPELITPESARLAMAYDPELGYMDDTAPGAQVRPSVIRSLEDVPPDMPAIEVPSLYEMSAEFRRRVPTLRFNSHIYSSDPTARRIMVNNVYLRQGQPFAGMTVQEITEDGAIFVLDGIMFSVNAARDWVNQ